MRDIELPKPTAEELRFAQALRETMPLSAEQKASSPYAKRAMLYAGKAVAGAVMRLFDNPALIEKAKAEHKKKIGDGYVWGLPGTAKPLISARKEL